MRKYQKWLVMLSDTEDYSGFLDNVSKLADIFLPIQMHVVLTNRKPDLPRQVLKDLPFLRHPELHEQKSQLEVRLKSVLHSDHSYKVSAVEEHSLMQILEYCKQDNTELMILQKASREALPIRAQKLVRKSPCSVLLLESKPLHLNHILAHLDFSNYSDLAIATIKELQEQSPLTNFTVVHTFRDATRYMDKVFERVDEVNELYGRSTLINQRLQANADYDLNDYLIKVGLKSARSEAMAYSTLEKRATDLIRYVNQASPDLLIIGSKDNEVSSVDLLSSLTEGLMQTKFLPTTLIQKERGENEGLLKTLLKFLS